MAVLLLETGLDLVEQFPRIFVESKMGAAASRWPRERKSRCKID
jgi:hypothetical protein